MTATGSTERSAGERWSEEWVRWRDGDDCPYCADGRPALDGLGTLFFEGDVVDGYLLNGENGFGSAMMIWKKGHASDLVELDDQSLTTYWSEVLEVSRHLMERYRPLKVHYFTHGNEVPHLQTLIMMRYDGDGVTNGVLYWSRGSSPHDADTMRLEAEALRAGVGS